MGARVLGQTPTTDPKSLLGRNLEVGIPDMTGDRSKHYMKITVKISNIEGKTCLTSFSGFECVREHLLRMVRKRNKKIESVFDVVTKDGWFLRMKPWTVLNGNPAAAVGNKMRIFTKNFLNEFASKNSIGEIIRKIISTEVQMRIKREGSKIYPVRFSEIARIKVLKSPEFKAAAPRPKPEEKPAEPVAEAKPAEKPKEKPAAEARPEEKPKEEKKTEKKETKKKK